MTVEGDQHDTSFAVWQTYRVPLILGALSLLFIVVSITIYIKSYLDVTPIQFSSDIDVASASSQKKDAQDLLFVDIEGAVRHPGVYRLPKGAHVEDLIQAAGGLSGAADTEQIGKGINRAAALSDGAKLYIPRMSDKQTSDAQPSSGSQVVGGVAIVNINTCSSSDLEALAGVGEVTAEKIIRNRPYMRLEELVEKKTMSQSVFDSLKNQLTL